jgi:hypothetical protein
MLEQALTSTRIVQTESLSAADLNSLVTYAGGADAQLLIIQDNRALEPRDCTVASLSKLRPVLVLDRVFPDPKVEDIMAMADEAGQQLAKERPLGYFGHRRRQHAGFRQSRGGGAQLRRRSRRIPGTHGHPQN